MLQKLIQKRCFDLCKNSLLNSTVHSTYGILIFENEIIYEGLLTNEDNDQAELNLLNKIDLTKQPHISKSTLFVFGARQYQNANNTIASAMIERLKIKKVIYPLNKLHRFADKNKNENAPEGPSIKVNTFLLRRARILLQPQNSWMTQQRPYIILKYATSSDGFIGRLDKQVWLSNNITKVISHKWRSEVDAILIGTKTAALDNPALTNRLSPGGSPLRIVIDRHLKLTSDLQIFDSAHPTWVFTSEKVPHSNHNLSYFRVDKEQSYLTAILTQLYLHNKPKLLVEGGAHLLQSFIDANLWDEARIFKTPVILSEGVKAPQFSGKLVKKLKLKNNWLEQWIKEAEQ